MIFDNCQTALLHHADSIQDHGALALLNRESGVLVACSQNLTAITGVDPSRMLGKPFRELVPAPLLDGMGSPQSAGKRRLWHTLLQGKPWMVSAYIDARQILLEFESAAESSDLDINQRFDFLEQVASFQQVDEVAEYLLERIAGITGFDRVMLYRFLPNWDGKVCAERLKPGVQGFLNHHFPAGDIPENARKLYTLNHQRFIADTESRTVPILTSGQIEPPDLTYSQLRAVHPVHIRYLQNMKVRASFSASLLSSGTLWGMIACHNRKPSRLGFSERFLCEELARMASLQISALQALSSERERSRLQLELGKIENIVASSTTPFETFLQWLDSIQRIMHADSVMVRFGRKRIAHGPVARSGRITVLRDWLRQQPHDEVWHHSRIPHALAGEPPLLTHAAGMLHIPLGNDNSMLLLRRELSEEIVWAGGKGKPDTALSPRASFEAWKEKSHGRAKSWSGPELAEASRFGQNLRLRLDKLQLQKLALEDDLTGLANRRGFEQELQTFLDLRHRREVSCAIFMIDLDLFKEVNDSMGHAAGDELLQQVGQRLKALLRSKDTVARLGGDEFAIVQYNVHQPPDVALVAKRIVAELHRPFKLEEGKAQIGASVGIALYPRHGTTMETLLERADAALYAVKKSGRNSWRLWEAEP